MNRKKSLRQCYKHFLFPSYGTWLASEWQKLSAQLLDLATSFLFTRDRSPMRFKWQVVAPSQRWELYSVKFSNLLLTQLFLLWFFTSLSQSTSFLCQKSVHDFPVLNMAVMSLIGQKDKSECRINLQSLLNREFSWEWCYRETQKSMVTAYTGEVGWL